jgi:hypothetical protein
VLYGALIGVRNPLLKSERHTRDRKFARISGPATVANIPIATIGSRSFHN